MGGEAELRVWISESQYSVILVSWIKIVRRWCQRHLGFGFISEPAAAFTVWPHQPHHDVTQPRSSSRLMWSIELQTAAADHAWRSVGLSVIQNPNACKGSFWKPIRRQIKLWVSCCWLDRVHITTEQRTGAAVYRLTTRNTCGRRMETMTHLLLFVAIDTCVYPFKWEHHLAATETWLLLN